MTIWIVETSVFPTGIPALQQAVTESGAEFRPLSEEDELRGRYGQWSTEDRIIFRGSFEAAESFRRARPNASPGVIGNPDALRCSAYYPTLNGFLLNETYRLITLQDLRETWPQIQAEFGPAVFVRPNTGAKAFTGQVVSDLTVFESRERPDLMGMAPEDGIVVAPTRQLDAEWRTIVIDRQVVTGSQYKRDNTRQISADLPTEIRDFAQSVAEQIQPPADAYMLDVARETNGRLSVIELNAFSSSDFYASDPKPIVAEIDALLTAP